MNQLADFFASAAPRFDRSVYPDVEDDGWITVHPAPDFGPRRSETDVELRARIKETLWIKP